SDYIPNSVIKGLLAAIGIILILKQFPHVLGYDIEQFGVSEFSLTPQDLDDSGNKETNTITLFFHSLTHINPGVVLIGVLSLFGLVYWEKHLHHKFRFIPGSLLIVLLGILINEFYRLYLPVYTLDKTHLVNIPILQHPFEVKEFLHFPDFNALKNLATYKLGITIAIVASIETLLSIEAVDNLDPEKRTTPVNRELLAQGVGNTLSGLLGGLPITSVIVRSSVNMNAGGRTKYSTIFHGILLLLSIIAIPSLLNKIPLATLAAILCYTGFKLTRPSIYRELFKQGHIQFIPFVVTALAIVLTDLLIGIVIGSLFAFFFILKDVFSSPIIKVLRTDRSIKIFLGENLTFLHRARIWETLKQIPDNCKVIIDGRRSIYIHHDIEELFLNFHRQAKIRNITLSIIGLKNIHLDTSLKQGKDEIMYNRLLEDNEDWAWEKLQEDSSFFEKLAAGQNPDFLIIGCSDSRVPINMLTKADPGHIFVHRNISNLVRLDDTNLMSILEYSVGVLKVRQIIILGHYNCGGVHAAVTGCTGVVEKWVQPIRKMYEDKLEYINTIKDENERSRRIVELNVIEQTKHLKQVPVVKESIEKYSYPIIHAWVYDLKTGLVKELPIDGSPIRK
ncbi:MAG: sulfate permease, partial [Leptospiraceae bacterium]|nr:sulfate permease [Leptospiraceae bacterium]